MTQCYEVYGTISDGSPLGGNVQVIMVRMVRTSDHKIVDLLLLVRIYKASLSGVNIASNILSELGRYKLEQENWRPAMQDRASSNSKALREIKRLTAYSPSEAPCLAHTFCLPGKEYKDGCPILHNFRKAFNKSIMFRGKLLP